MKRQLTLLLALFLLPSCSVHDGQGTRPAADPTFHPPLTAGRTVLENGLTVVAVEKHNLPIFQVELVVLAGSARDPEGKAGTANLTAGLLSKGTAKRSASRIAEEIDYTGGSIDVSCGRVTTRGSVHVLVEHAPLAMDILKDMFIDPALADDEVAREKARVVSEIIRGREEPFQVVSDAFQEEVYAGSPLGRPVVGYEKTLATVERNDLLDFHRSYYAPNNSFLVIVADKSVSEMTQMAREYFGSWERKDIDAPLITAPERPSAKSVRLVDMDINQSYVALGHLGLRRSDPDYNAVLVMNYILGGGGFVSRITKSVRGRQGLAYSAYSYFMPGPSYEGFFRAGLETKLSSTSQAVTSLLAEIEGMRNELVSEKELEDAKSYYEGSLPRRQETYGQIAGLFADKELYGLEDDYWIRDVEKIRSLTREEIRRVAAKYLDPENYTLVIATNVDSLRLEVEGVTQDIIRISVP